MINQTTTLDLNGPILSFTQQPSSVAVCDGGTATFVGIATATFPTPATNTGSISYRWYDNNGPLSDSSNVSGSNTNTLVISNLSNPSDNGRRFYLRADYVPSAYGLAGVAVTVGSARSTGNAINDTLDSSIATLTVYPTISITQNPSSTTVSTGQLANFTVQATSTDSVLSNLSYKWQLNGSDLNDNGSTIFGSSTNNLQISSSSTGTNTVRARVSHPTACNSSIFSSSASFAVVNPRALVVVEDEYVLSSPPVVITQYDLSNSSITLYGQPNPGKNLYLYAPERNLRVRILLAAAAGLSRNGFSGGEGGVSVFDYTLEKDIEYVIKLATTTFPIGGANGGGGVSSLYRKSILVASCGGGGGAGTNGNGGAGGGINVAGGSGFGRSAGTGGRYVSPGTFLSGSFRSGATGGIISTCMNGAQVISLTGISACAPFPGLTQARDGANVTYPTTAFLNRGYKPGSPNGYRNNGGDGSGNDGGGGSGAYGGNAATGGFGGGGGGGSGYTDGSISLVSTQLGGNQNLLGFITISLIQAL